MVSNFIVFQEEWLMGRTRKESSIETSSKKPLSSTERSKKHWLDPLKRVADNIKCWNACQLKAKNNLLSEEELRKKWEADLLRNKTSWLKQSNQKKVGARIMDRNWKWRVVEDLEGIAVPSSTEWVRKHCQDKIKFDFCSKKQKVEHVAKAVNSTLPVLSPQSKVHAVSQTCSKSLSPTSRCNVASNIHGDLLVDFNNMISKKCDKIMNCAWGLVLRRIAKKARGSWKQTRQANWQISWKSLKHASEKDINSVTKHYKTVKSKACKPPTETTKKVLEFYNRDISRQLPYKNLTCKVKDHLGVCHCVPVRVMEVTLRNVFKSFKKDNASIKISERTFQQFRPKHSSMTLCPVAAVLLHLSH